MAESRARAAATKPSCELCFFRRRNLCALDLDSSALLARAALLTAPINPTRDHERVGFTFRCARRAGYGVSPSMARRCFERLDGEGILGRVEVLRLIADTDNVGTQGAVWYVEGKAL